MCEFCGCTTVKVRPRSAEQDIATTLAAVPVMIVMPSAEDARGARERLRLAQGTPQPPVPRAP